MEGSEFGEVSEPPVADAAAPSVAVACPNCGAEKQGRFCAVCGQNDRDYLHSLFPVVSQILAEAFEADSRVWRTMRALFLSPGLLSLEFSRNRRANYMSPFRLYLFTSLVFFLVLSLAAAREDREPSAGEPLVEVHVGQDGDAAEALPDVIATLKRHLDTERRSRIDEIMARPESSASRGLFSVIASALAGGDEGLDGPMDIFFAGQLVDVFHAPWPIIRDRIFGYLPAGMFFVLPLYALLLKLVFIRRHRFYAEHLVFSMHIHTVVFIVFAVMLLTPPAWPGWIDGGLLLALMAYYCLALKRFYGTGVFATLASFVFLMWLYSLVLVAALLGAFAALVLLF